MTPALSVELSTARSSAPPASRPGIRRAVVRLTKSVARAGLILAFRVLGPPRVLLFGSGTNAAILRAFGATIGSRNVRLHAPITLHGAEEGYAHLSIADDCILNGNNYLDLAGRIVLEEGVSLGPGVVINTHNRYNHNAWLEQRLAVTCGVRDVTIKRGAGIKAGAVVVMGVTVGEDSVVAAGAMVNQNVPARTIVAGAPARVLRRLG
jgi:acetyltransferase-like isoleucine patch superfamily enzyme